MEFLLTIIIIFHLWSIGDKLDVIIKSKKNRRNNNENDSTPSIPYDLDDFSRCVLAANAFNYTEKDIQNGIQTIKTIIAPPRFLFLFENFLKMKEEFEAGNTEVVKKFISKLREIKSRGER